MAKSSAAHKSAADVVESTAPSVRQSSAGAKVTVACKLGVAWFEMEICEEESVSENTQTGPRSIKQWKRTGKIQRVRGTAYPTGAVPEGFPDKPEMLMGYALTRNVDKEFWEAWSAQHAKAPYVVNRMIYAFESLDHGKGVAAEMKGQMSGLEPVQRTKDKITDARVVKPVMKGIEEIAPSERP